MLTGFKPSIGTGHTDGCVSKFSCLAAFEARSDILNFSTSVLLPFLYFTLQLRSKTFAKISACSMASSRAWCVCGEVMEHEAGEETQRGRRESVCCGFAAGHPAEALEGWPALMVQHGVRAGQAALCSCAGGAGWRVWRAALSLACGPGAPRAQEQCGRVMPLPLSPAAGSCMLGRGQSPHTVCAPVPPPPQVEVVWLGRRFTPPVIGSILVVLAGVAIVTVSDVAIHAVGLVMALLFIVTSGLQQIL